MDAGQVPADITLNEANPQKNDIPLVVVDSGTTRRSLQDANINHVRALFQVELEEARGGFENRLAEIYQRKNRDREEELSLLRDEYASYKKQTEQQMKEMCKMARDRTARFQQVIDGKGQLAEMYQRKEAALHHQLDDMKNQLLVVQQNVQHHQDTAATATNNCSEMSQQLASARKTHGEQTNELNLLRDEYATYKQQTEQRMEGMSTRIRNTSARYQQVLEEKERLAELCANFSAGFQAYDALKKGDEERLGVATPQRLSDQNLSGHKRKRPDVSSSSVTASASRMNSVAPSSSPQFGTTRKASPIRSRFSDKIRLLLSDAGNHIRTENTGEKEIRQDTPAQAGKQRGNCVYYCGICQESQVQGGQFREANAVAHMLGFRPKDGSQPGTYGPCATWRKGTLNPQDRQDYLLGKYPRRGVRYVKYKNELRVEVAEEGYGDWTKEMAKGRGVVIVDRDQADAEAAQAVISG